MHKIFLILLFTYGLAITNEHIYDNSYALIIGIDKYENAQNLNYAVKDAESIQDILINTFNFSENNITFLKNEEATLLNIKNSLSEISSSATENDRVLIYFAGHGVTHDLPEGGEMGYLLPIDGKKDNLFATSIPMTDIKSISSMSNSKHMLFLIDACYSGLLTIGSRGLDPTTPNYIDKITKDKGRQIITAGGRDEKVVEKAEWGHSAFALNLKRGLKDGNADMDADGYITAYELGLFLNKKVTIDSGNQQTPQYGKMTSQEGQFIFVYSDNTVIIQDKSDDEKFDLLLSKIEKIESQTSINEKSALSLQVNPSPQQTDNPLSLHFIFTKDIRSLNLTKYIGEQSEVGFGYAHVSLEGIDTNLDAGLNTWYGDNYKFNTEAIYINYLYYLRNKKTTLFNPLVLSAMKLSFIYLENTTKQVSDDIKKLGWVLALSNQTHIYKNIGVTFGVLMQKSIRWGFSERNTLYEMESDIELLPYLTIDITFPTFSKKKD